MLVLALSRPTLIGVIEMLIAEIKQRSLRRIDTKHDIAAVAPVAAIRSAEGHVFLPAEATAAVSAASGMHMYSRVIDKHTAYIRSIIAVPNSEHLTSVAPSIRRAKS